MRAECACRTHSSDRTSWNLSFQQKVGKVVKLYSQVDHGVLLIGDLDVELVRRDRVAYYAHVVEVRRALLSENLIKKII